MTKQELIAHFQEQKKIIEREIVFWQAQPDADAEKPKRRHGDFGIDFDKNKEGKLHFPVIVIKKGLGGSLDMIYRDGSSCDRRGEDDITWLGNIFDLLKEWSEDLGENVCISGLRIEKSNISRADIFIGGDEHLNLDEAYKFWCKLGHKIMFLKRKQSLT